MAAREPSQPNSERKNSIEAVELRPSERGLLLGMTETGKSTVQDELVSHAREKWRDQLITIFDTKPRYRATRELNGLPPLFRYRRWDDGHGITIPDSVVIGPPADPWPQLRWAWGQKYQVTIFQIRSHDDLPWLSRAMRAAYEHKPKGKKLLIVVDEGNHWFRGRRSNGNIVIEILTSGRENNVGMLIGGQRPYNFSKESMESLTNLYWLHTPAEDDVKHLHHMGVPWTAQPGGDGDHSFYFWSRKRNRAPAGLYRMPAPIQIVKAGKRYG